MPRNLNFAQASLENINTVSITNTTLATANLVLQSVGSKLYFDKQEIGTGGGGDFWQDGGSSNIFTDKDKVLLSNSQAHLQFNSNVLIQVQDSSRFYSVQIGRGEVSSSQGAIGIGYNSGGPSQGSSAVAIGTGAGDLNQGSSAIAIGENTGQIGQGSDAIALGERAGRSSQGTKSISIGYFSGVNGQNNYSIAIGHKAGEDGQHLNSIVLNSNSGPLNTTQSDSFFVRPIRQSENPSDSTSNVVWYNRLTHELCYNP
jgi:hypothetical protein